MKSSTTQDQSICEQQQQLKFKRKGKKIPTAKTIKNLMNIKRKDDSFNIEKFSKSQKVRTRQRFKTKIHLKRALQQKNINSSKFAVISFIANSKKYSRQSSKKSESIISIYKNTGEKDRKIKKSRFYQKKNVFRKQASDFSYNGQKIKEGFKQKN